MEQDLGAKGEELALDYLLNEGYELKYKNWRYGKDEIDIIMEIEDFIVFVEVKTRSTAFFGQPYEFVGRSKQKFMIRAANAYVDKYQQNKEIRFDIISIVSNQNETNIEHIADAFNAIG